MRLRRLACLALAAGPAAAQPAAQEPSAATLAKIAPSILRVVADGCGGDEPARAGSGFAWPKPGLVVTDLHVVAGCTRIRVGYQGQDERPAQIARVLVAADLVLLAVDGAPATPSLAAAPQPPPVGATVDVFGFALGQPTRDTHPLHLTFGNEESPLLSDVLPDSERDGIRKVGFPALTTQVLRLDGNLLPGHSGAPLIDAEGQVVGIGSGGLERGAVGVGWAIRAQYLTALLTAADKMPAQTAVSGSAFAVAAPSQSAADSARCGQLTLFARSTRPLAQLAETSDDPDRLDRLSTSLVEVPLTALGANRFTIWTEPNSGAATIIPLDLLPVPGPEYCLIHSYVPTVRYLVRMVPLPGHPGDGAWRGLVKAEERKSSLLIDQEAGVPMQAEPGGAFQSRRSAGGTLLLRRTFHATGKDGHALRIYRSDIAGRGAYLMTAVINTDAVPPASAAPAARFAWARGVFAVNLSGFPPAPGTGGQQPAELPPEAAKK